MLSHGNVVVEVAIHIKIWYSFNHIGIIILFSVSQRAECVTLGSLIQKLLREEWFYLGSFQRC